MKPIIQKDNRTNDNQPAQNNLLNKNKPKEVLALQNKLFQKIYCDLFQSNPSFYQSKNLTYENFIYYFYNDLLLTFDYTRESLLPYDQLLLEAEEKILSKFPPSNAILSMSSLQKKYLALQQKKDDDWTIVSQYQTQLYKEEEKRQLSQIAQSFKDYYQSLTNQIEDKKNYEQELKKKKQQELQAKYNKEREALLKTQLSIKQNIVQLMKNEEHLSLDFKKRFKSKLEREAIVNQSLHSLLAENDNITNASKDIIQYKLGLIANEQQKALINKAGYTKSEIEISNVVNQIMKQKEDQRLYNTIIKASDNVDYKANNKIKSKVIPDMEEKVNAIIKNKMNENITKGIDINYNI